MPQQTMPQQGLPDGPFPDVGRKLVRMFTQVSQPQQVRVGFRECIFFLSFVTVLGIINVRAALACTPVPNIRTDDGVQR